LPLAIAAAIHDQLSEAPPASLFKRSRGREWTSDDLERAQAIYKVDIPLTLESGSIVGSVIFQGAEPDAGGGWAWNLSDPKPCKPKECKGQVGLWHVR
jgi:hypothetical protein